MPLHLPRVTYKPFEYPWAYDAWMQQQRVHWLFEEIPLGDDVKEYQHKLAPNEINLLVHILRFFTQSDKEVLDNYMERLMQVFKPVEIKMMLIAFANMETIHMPAYAYVNDTIGMPESDYSIFMEYEEMRDKYDFMQGFNIDDPFQVARCLAVFGAFIEGLQLFASFAILLNFPRNGTMRGMGQIISWSVRDESLHCNSIIRLYHAWMDEHPEIDRKEMAAQLHEDLRTVIKHEDKFIDLAFEQGPIGKVDLVTGIDKRLTAEQTKAFIRYVGNARCQALGIRAPYSVKANPLPWFNSMVGGVEHANFFEQGGTEYSKTATGGDWDDSLERFFTTRQPTAELAP